MFEKMLAALESIAASLAILARGAQTAGTAAGELGLAAPETTATAKNAKAAGTKTATAKDAKGAGAAADSASTASSSGASTSANTPAFTAVTEAIMALSKKKPEEGGGRAGVVDLLAKFLPDVPAAERTVSKLQALNKNQEIIDAASGKAAEGGEDMDALFS